MMETINLIDVKNWVDAARFGVTPDGYTSLKLGSTIVGWTSPPLAEKDDVNYLIVKAVVGRKVYDFELNALSVACDAFEIDAHDALGVQANYIAHTVLNLPVGSVDLTTHGTLINYTKRTAETLCSALTNFFRLRAAHVQAEMHRKTEPEVMEMMLALGNSQYSWKHLNRMTWRGTLLTDLIKSSRMMWFEEGVRFGQTTSISPVAEQAEYFMNFISLQSPSRKRTPWGGVAKFEPKNVFFLKADSDEEYLLGERLFKGSHQEYLRMFLREVSDEIIPEYDKVIFFDKADSCLAKWIMGTTVTVNELHKMVIDNGYTLSD